MKYTTRNLITGILGAVFILGMQSCNKPAPKNAMAGGPVPVNLQPVQLGVASYHDIYPGNIVALNEVQLRSEVSGYISGIFFKEGQTLRKGQKLYEIERDRYEANYAKAAAGVAMAEANVDKAKKDADRYNMLAKKEAIAKQRVEYAQTDLTNMQQQLASAKATLRQASIDLQHAVITAPFDGTIGISSVKLGTFVTAGQTILNTLSSDDPIAVDFVISEREIPRFMALKDQKTAAKDSLFTILLADKSLYKYPGEVEIYDRAVDPQTGTFRIRLRFPNPEHYLRTGMSCNVRIRNNSGKEVIQVPFKAIVEQMSEYFVYVVENDTARQRKVTIGPPIGANVIVFSGLEPTDKIVVDGIQKLRDGAPVQLGAPKQPAGNPEKK